MKLIVLLIFSAFNFAAISTKQLTFSKAAAITMDRELAEGSNDKIDQTHEFDMDHIFGSSYESLFPGSNKYLVKKPVYNKFVIINSSINFIYLAHAPPFLV